MATWNAPAAMNSTWSVLTGPYFVLTVEPSTIGRMSRCTPSRETSGPEPLPRPATLSISSKNTMPCCSARSMASVYTRSMSIRFCSSSASRILRASRTVTRRSFIFFGRMPPSTSFMFMSVPGMSARGVTSSTSTSTISFSISPRRRRVRTSSCRTASLSRSSGLSSGSFARLPSRMSMGLVGFFFGAWVSSSTSRFSTLTSACPRTRWECCSLTRRIDASIRSRIMDSTSRPT